MPAKKNWLGLRFGGLVVIKELPKQKAEAVCDCGNKTVVARCNLTSGHTTSCGCLRGKNLLKHGHSQTAEHRAWKAIVNYSQEKGTKIDSRWAESFKHFLDDMGLKPTPQHLLVRLNHEKGYHPNNCAWLTRKEKLSNRWVGKKYGKLTVIKALPRSMARVVCDCGNTTVVCRNNLTDGHTTSCGCTNATWKHRLSATVEYRAWYAMIDRCTNPKNKRYKDYGGRGIKVCSKWIGSFESFLHDMGHRPGAGYSLDRINNEDNYYPENCRWATAKTQANNRRLPRRQPCL